MDYSDGAGHYFVSDDLNLDETLRVKPHWKSNQKLGQLFIVCVRLEASHKLN